MNTTYGVGGGIDGSNENFDGCAPGATILPIDRLCSYAVTGSDTKDSSIDVLEIFGGEGGVTRCAVRRRLKCGTNVDLITGVDLTCPEQVRKLLLYV